MAIGRSTKPIVVGGCVLAAALAISAGPARAFSAASVYRTSAPSVVVIFGFDARGRGHSGTGTILSHDGLILTNDHVVTDPRAKGPYATLQVYLKPDRVTGDDRRDLRSPHRARVLARDEALDLALLQLIDPPPGLAPIAIGDSEEVEVGESVAAIGHPGGGGLWTLTTGTVSSVRRDGVRDVFQTDTAINPGNSGGPLLDEHARLIGVNTFVRRVNEQGLPLEGLNYSLRSALALEWLDEHTVGLAAVRRADAVEAAPIPAPSAAPAPTDEPSPSPSPAEAPAIAGRPEDVAPAGGAAGEAAPEQSPPPAGPPAAADDAPRAFEGEHGEAMFGVPSPGFRLDAAMKDAYRRTLKHASEAFDELDGAFHGGFDGEDIVGGPTDPPGR